MDEYVLRVIRGRLAQPDLADLLVKPADEAALAALRAEREELDHRLAVVESDYDEGLIDGRRYAAAVDKVSARITEIQRRQAALVSRGSTATVLGAPDPVAAFDAAPLAIRQRLIDALAVITLHKGVHGSRTFRPESVTIQWR